MEDPVDTSPIDGLTQAKRDLIAEVAALGEIVSGTQLDRMRTQGLIPKPFQRSAGRGPGRRSTHYPEGTAQRVAAICRIRRKLGRRAPDQDLPMWLFLFGHEVDLRHVRESFNSDVNGLLAWQIRYKSADAAARLGANIFRNVSRTFLGKLVSRNLGVRAIRYESPAGIAVHAAIDFVLGHEPQPEGLRNILRAFGFDDERMQDETLRTLAGFSLRSLSARLDEVSDEQLMVGRDNILRLVEMCARGAHPAMGKTWELRAFRMGAFLRVRAISGMIAVIQMANAESSSEFVTDNLIRGLDEARSVPSGRESCAASPMVS